MQTRTHDWWLLAFAMGLAALQVSRGHSVQSHAATAHVRSSAFPPARHAITGTLAARAIHLDADREIAELGRRAPKYQYAARRAFEETPDRLDFVLGHLPDAKRGDGASQYLIYLALEQCRTWLRLNTDSARELSDSLQIDFENLSVDERRDSAREYQRCAGFASRDWSEIGNALGADRPGAETEYGSVWFERAAREHHPPALAEQALRRGPLNVAQRRAQLEEAAASADPDVYWLLFAHSSEVETGRASMTSLAWLIAACRAGYDCTAGARWYRDDICMSAGAGCEPRESAVEHYWYAASADERGQAHALAGKIQAAINDGRWNELPWPDLEPLGNDQQYQTASEVDESGSGAAEENDPDQTPITHTDESSSNAAEEQSQP